MSEIPTIDWINWHELDGHTFTCRVLREDDCEVTVLLDEVTACLVVVDARYKPKKQEGEDE